MDIESDLERALRRESPPEGFSSPVAGGWAAHEEMQRREGERARDEVLLALRIAGSKVRTAQEQVHEIGTH